jgi:dihydrofolate reductase
MSVSVDGYFEGPDGDIGWAMVDEEVHTYVNDVLRPMGVFLNGRVNYELMQAFWPTADQDPAAPPPVVDFARIWRETPKIVYSRTLEHVDGNTTIVREVVADEVNALKAEAGGDLALGGAILASAFMAQDLIDEYILYVHPVIVGGGRTLFGPSDRRQNLTLVDSHTFGNGVVHLRYRRR